MIACLAPFWSNFLTFCGVQKVLHKSTQNQQMLNTLSNSKRLAKINIFLSPNLNYTIKNDKTCEISKNVNILVLFWTLRQVWFSMYPKNFKYCPLGNFMGGQSLPKVIFQSKYWMSTFKMLRKYSLSSEISTLKDGLISGKSGSAPRIQLGSKPKSAEKWQKNRMIIKWVSAYLNPSESF